MAIEFQKLNGHFFMIYREPWNFSQNVYPCKIKIAGFF